MNAGLKTIAAMPKCGAWGRHAQRPCQKPPIRGKTRCALHGGKNPGAPRANGNALVHGRYSAAAEAAKREATAAKRAVGAAVKAAVALAEAVTKRPRGRPPIHGRYAGRRRKRKDDIVNGSTK